MSKHDSREYASSIKQKTMLYRQKFLLALIELNGGAMHATRLQKYSFECAQHSSNDIYHFVPFTYGCYSFCLAAELRTLTRRGYLEELVDERHHTWRLTNGSKPMEGITPEDRLLAVNVSARLSKLSSDDLLRYIYTTYPYYATRSRVAGNILSDKQLRVIETMRPKDCGKLLATVGYEGRSLDEFLDTLLRHNIHALVDIRRNAFSMKRGFSKGQLRNACEELGIAYVHMPDLGVASKERKHLETADDYRRLFMNYRRALMKQAAVLEPVEKLLAQYTRIALMCFEKDPAFCHRSSCVKVYRAMHPDGYDMGDI